MPPAHVQSNATGDSASASTIVQAFGSNVTAGNLIYVAVSWDHSGGGGGDEQLSSMADSLGNTYTQITNCHKYDAGNTQVATAYYAPAILGGANTVTATFLGSRAFRRLVVVEYSGLLTVGPLDASGGQVQNPGPGTGTDALTSGSVTAGNNGELVVGQIMSTGGYAGTMSAGTSFTKRAFFNNSGTSAEMAVEDRVLSLSGLVAATWTQTVNQAGIISVATFRAADQPTGAPGFAPYLHSPMGG